MKLKVYSRKSKTKHLFVWICVNKNILFTTEELLEVAIESWLEWNLNPRPLNPIHRL